MTAPSIPLPDPDLSLRVALTLLHFFWQGAVIAGAAAVACALLRRASSPARYAVLLGAMLVMVVSPVATFLLLGPAPGHASNGSADVQPSAPSVGSIETAGKVPQAAPASAAGPSDTRGTATEAVPPSAPAIISTPVSSTTGALARWIDPERLKPLAPWMTLAYLCGALAMTARLLLALRGGQRLRRAAEPVTEEHLLAAVRRQVRRLGLRREPLVAWCRHVAAPSVVGVLRPAILLPIALSSGMSASQVESILAHELAHVRRLDPLANVVQGLIEALLFFHPAVWFVSRRLRLERENCCDDLVLSAGGAPLDYVKSLVRAAELGLLEHSHASAGAAALAAVGRPSQLRQRIVRLLQGEPAPQLRVSPGPMVVLLLLAATLSAGAWYRIARAEAADDDRSPAASTFVGRLTDPEGRPVSNGYIGPAGSNLYKGSRTDADGVFRLSNIGPNEKHWAAFSQRSRRMALFTIPSKPPAEPVPVTLLYRNAEADGRVVDAAGTPVPGEKVTLHVTTAEGTTYSFPSFKETDEYGGYGAHFVPAGEGLKTRAVVGDGANDDPHVDATAVVSFGRVYTMEVPDLVTKQPGKAPAKPAPPRVRYSGRVVDEAGKPVAGAELQMYYPKNNMVASAGTLVTDSDGRFSRLIPADAERVDLRLSHPECLSYQFDRTKAPPPVQTLRDGSAVIVMKRGLAVRGVVNDPSGKPVSNALVMAAKSYATTAGPENEPIEDFTSPRTAKDGTFRVGGLPAGWLEFTVVADGYPPVVDRVEVKPDAPPVELKLAQGKSYAARVVDPDGKPLEGVTVYACDWRIGGEARRIPSRRDKTDAEGRFTLRGMPAEGQLEVSVGKADYLSTTYNWSAAGPEVASLTLYPKPVIRGRVVDADSGQPVKNFRAVSYWMKKPSPITFNSPADGRPDGTFELRIDRVILSKPEATPFYAEIQAKGYVPQMSPEVYAGKPYEPFVIKLEKGEPVTGIVTDADDKPLDGATVAIVAAGQVAEIEGTKFAAFSEAPRPRAKSDSSGRFELPTVRAEGRLLVLHDKGYLVVPYPGLPNDAKLTVIPWARVEGTARKDGKALHGVRVALEPGNADALFGGNVRFNLRAPTHVNGRFVFENVPSVRWRAEVEGGNSPSVELTPEPGKTQSIELGGPGAPGVG